MTKRTVPSTWWNVRSKTLAYQHAYDSLASEIKEIIQSRERPVVVVDVACGTGEIIRRVYRSGRIIFGTDIDLPMLSKASANLGKYHIPSRLVTKAPKKSDTAWRKILRGRKVVLLADDCLSSKLPPKSFDIAINTFVGFPPELLRKRERGKRNIAVAQDRAEMLLRAQKDLDREVHKILKEGGIFIRTIYYRKHRSKKAIEIARRMNSLYFSWLRRHFSIIKIEFVPSELIGMDANTVRDAGFWSWHYRTGDFGYKILFLKKRIKSLS